MSGQSVGADGGTGIGQEENDILSPGLTDILTRLKPNRCFWRLRLITVTIPAAHTLSADVHNVTYYFPLISPYHP